MVPKVFEPLKFNRIDDLKYHALLNGILVILERWEGDNERLYAIMIEKISVCGNQSQDC